jgi:phosphoribosyl-AMP cyclohydrolase
MTDNWLDRIKWTADGLVPAIAQDAGTGRVLMMAWMNRESLRRTVPNAARPCTGPAPEATVAQGRNLRPYPENQSIRLDCDHDVLLLEIEQIGGIACHTGRQSCFLRNGAMVNGSVTDPCTERPARDVRRMSDQILRELAATLEARKQADPDSSYVARLYAKGWTPSSRRSARKPPKPCWPPRTAIPNIWCVKPPICGFIPWSCWPIKGLAPTPF